MQKKISIITVVKNGMPYLKSALKIFHKQKYKNKEIIIIYSKSTDGTLEFLKKNKKKYNKLIIDKNSKNKFGSLNIGIKPSCSIMVIIMDSMELVWRSANDLSGNNATIIFALVWLFCTYQSC